MKGAYTTLDIRGLSHEEVVVAANELEAAAGALLANKHPSVVGTALASLVATWVAGHRPDLREGVLTAWAAMVKELVPVYAQRTDAMFAALDKELGSDEKTH